MPDPVATTCSRCGEPVAPGAKFCPKCGADVSGQQSSVATAYVSKVNITRATMSQQALLDVLRHATLGEYEILGELGRGGMATVYLAQDIALDRKVAIKVMSPSLTEGEGMVERFKREARTAASLSHPNIIPIYAVRESEHIVFFVMKFVEGRPLDSIIKEVGPLPIPMVRTILQQVGGALAYAHRRGIIHRDIKPANIMVDTDGWAVVTDFGIAKVIEAKGLTMTGATVGTPSYMSPEQCAAKELSGASDQYSLGIVAYEMLAGKLPFVAESIMAIMYAHFNEPPPPISNARPDCPPELADALMRMLEKEPEKRYPDAEAAVAAIGGTPLSLDDPIRGEMKTLAATGLNLELLKRVSTPVSPTPAGRTKSPGKTAQTTRGVPFSVRPPQVTVAVGGAVQLSAARKSQGNRTLPGTQVAWASTNPDVASVSEEGLVTAIAPGAAVITVTSEGASATSSITVTPVDAGGGRLWLKLAGGVAVAAIAAGVWLFGPWHGQPKGSPSSTAAPSETLATQSAQGAAPDTHTVQTTSTAPPPVNLSPPTGRGGRPAGPAGETRGEIGRELRTGGAAIRNDSILREFRTTARTARERAAVAGATPVDLAPGDAEVRTAELLAGQGGSQVSEAISHLSQAASLFGTAETTARNRGVAAQAPPKTEAQPPTAPVATAPVDPKPLIEAAIASYGRALETRDVESVRRAYPGLTATQAQGWRDFFGSVSSLKTNLHITQSNVTGDQADASVEGSFQYVQDRRSQTQPLKFHASLERRGASWQIVAIQ